VEPVADEVIETVELEGPAAVAAEVPPSAGSGIVARTAPNQPVAAETDDDYDISGYDLSRYDSGNGSNGSLVEDDTEPLKLTGADDPDAAEEDDEDDDVVGAGAGRRRSRRGGTRRRTRP
jgi:ribonuclease E